MTPFSLFLGDEYLGDGLQSYPESVHYFCRRCGNIWARRISARPATHWVWTGHCPEHDDADWGPPVLCEEVRFRTIRWPIEALVRDFLYLMERKFSAPVIVNNLPLERSYDSHQSP
jgi:hypothetical protein